MLIVTLYLNNYPITTFLLALYFNMYSFFVLVTMMPLTSCAESSNYSFQSLKQQNNLIENPTKEIIGVNILHELESNISDDIENFEDLSPFCETINITDPQDCTCEYIQSLYDDFPCQHSQNNSIHEIKVNYGYKGILDKTHASLGIIAGVVGILGNLMVIHYYVKTNSSLNNCKLLICLLALCDTFFAVVYIIIEIPSFWTAKWIYGSTMCKVLFSISDLGAHLAIGVVVIIALERYYGIAKPFENPGLSRGVVVLLLLTNIAISLATTVPAYLVYENTVPTYLVYEQRYKSKCQKYWPDMKSKKAFAYANLVTYIIIPTVIITYVYVTSIKTILNLDREESIRNRQMKLQRAKENRRITITLVGIMVMFIVCVLPNHAVRVAISHIENIGQQLTRDQYLAMKYIALFPYPFHVAMNPIVYCCMQSAFRTYMSQWRVNCLRSNRGGSEEIKRRWNDENIFHNYELASVGPSP